MKVEIFLFRPGQLVTQELQDGKTASLLHLHRAHMIMTHLTKTKLSRLAPEHA